MHELMHESVSWSRSDVDRPTRPLGNTILGGICQHSDATRPFEIGRFLEDVTIEPNPRALCRLQRGILEKLQATFFKPRNFVKFFSILVGGELTGVKAAE